VHPHAEDTGVVKVVVHPHAEDTGTVNVAAAEVAEVMVRAVTSAVKTPMVTVEDMVLEVVPELEVKKSSRTGRGALGHPTKEAGEVGFGTVGLGMILRGHLEGLMSAIAVLAVGTM
jgi:hypothetical protein